MLTHNFSPSAGDIHAVGTGGVCADSMQTASMVHDAMAETLFGNGQDALLNRHHGERELRIRIQLYWEHLAGLQHDQEVSESTIREKLAALDVWASNKLSGRNVLHLAVYAERHYPEWIALMPRLLASRYEELRMARLWSALLNPKALRRLRLAIESERAFAEMDED